MSLSAITAVDSKYWFFAGAYVYFLQKSNPGIKMLIWVDTDDTVKKITPEINWCKHNIGADVILQFFPEETKAITNGPGKIRGVRGDDIRFVAMPPQSILNTDYCAVTDSDILYLNDMESDIAERMELADNIYLGLQREARRGRMTGTFYNKPSLFYPKCSDQMKIHRKNRENYDGDEYLLYEIMNNSGIRIDNTNQSRPIYGIHASIHREPYGELNWEIKEGYVETYMNYLNETDFKSVMNAEYRKTVHDRLLP